MRSIDKTTLTTYLCTDQYKMGFLLNNDINMKWLGLIVVSNINISAMGRLQLNNSKITMGGHALL